MFKHTLTGLLCLLTLTATAKRNSVTVGILTGQTGTFNNFNDYGGRNHLDNSPEERLAISFTSEVYFDKSKKHFYLSIPMRLHTNRFIARENAPYNYTSSYYPSYYTRSYTVTSASLCAGIGLNYIPVGSDKIALLTNLSLMPAMEAGEFKGGVRGNACGELYIGLRLMNRVMMGARAVSFLLPYSPDDFSMTHNEYNITNLMFDLRFNIKK